MKWTKWLLWIYVIGFVLSFSLSNIVMWGVYHEQAITLLNTAYQEKGIFSAIFLVVAGETLFLFASLFWPIYIPKVVIPGLMGRL